MALVTVTLTVSPYDRVPESDQRSVYATLLYGPVHDSINDYDILGRKRRVGYVDQTTGSASFTLERNSDTDDPDSVWRVQVGGANYLRRWTSSTPSTVDLGDDTWEVGQTPPNGVDYQLRSERGQPNGYAPLDSGGLVPTANLPSGGGGGGGAPTGSAGGDLAGTYPSPTVPGLVTNATAITAEATARTAADAAHVAATDPHGDRAYTNTQVTAEATTRASADTTLTTAVAGKAAATDLTAEVSRAEAAEATKAAATDLTAEVTRATGVEAAKADLVSGLVPTAQIPPIALTQPFPVADQTAMLALTAQPGDFAIRADNTKSYVLAASPASTLSNWLELTSTGQVASVNTQTGAVVLGAADVGAASASALTSEVTRATNAEGLLLPASDPSVTNARTPTAHATTHASAGSDAVTLAESQVTGLTSDLAAKLAATDASVTNARTPTGTAGGDLTGTYPSPTLATARAIASRLISAGSGLTGGGDLTADRTLTVDIATATPLGQVSGGAVGTSPKPARQDHQHPVAGGSVPTPFVFARGVGTRYGSGSQSKAGTGHGLNAAGKLLLLPVWLYAGAVSVISVYVATAQVSTWRLGLYPVSSSTSLPDGQGVLLDAGTVSTNATGVQGVSISYTVAANGWYWSAAQCDAYTANPAVAFVSGDVTANGGNPDSAFGVPVVNGIPCSARVATGVTVGALPATCPTTSATPTSPRVMFLAA